MKRHLTSDSLISVLKYILFFSLYISYLYYIIYMFFMCLHRTCYREKLYIF